MPNTLDLVNLKIMSLKDFQDNELAVSVISKINEYGKEFIPNVFGLYQPLKNKYSPKKMNETVEFWMNNENNKNSAKYFYAAGQLLIEKNKGHKVSYQMRWEKDDQERFNYFNLFVEIGSLKNEKGLQRFLDFCNDIAKILEPVHGEIVNLSFRGWDAPINLKIRHPELNWFVIFGKPYIELFGKENILSSPAHSVHTISNEIIALQLTDCLFKPIPSSVRTAVKNHLCQDAFVEEGKSYKRYSNGKVPEFDFSNILFNK